MTGGYYLDLKNEHQYAVTADTLDKIVKAKGDEVVTATFRRKKLKKCNGYRSAHKRAIYTFSEIAGGVRNDDGTFYAKLRIRIEFVIILLILVIVAALIFSRIAAADEDINETTTSHVVKPNVVIPEETTTCTEAVSNFYISIPGIKHIYISSDNTGYCFNNPTDNICYMKYEVYIDDKLITETGYIGPGCQEQKELYSLLIAGDYSSQIVVKSRSEDGMTDYNSVKQYTQITVDN